MAKRGPKGYAAKDAIHIARALDRMKAGETAWHAAQAVAPQMDGHGTHLSKARRLRGYLAKIEDLQSAAEDQFIPPLFVEAVTALSLIGMAMPRKKKKKNK